MTFGGSTFAESTFAGTVFDEQQVVVEEPGPGEPRGTWSTAPPAIDFTAPFVVEIDGQSYKPRIDTLEVEIELGRQGTARFGVLNLQVSPEIGQSIRIIYYDHVLFGGQIDRINITTDPSQTFIRYQLDCTDHSYLLHRRIIKRTFTNQSVVAITNALLANELFYDGLSYGVVDAMPVIPNAVADNISIFQFLSELAASVGTVFFVDHQKKLNFIGASISLAPLSLNASTIEECSVLVDRETYRNVQTTEVHGTPTGQNEQAISIAVRRSNSEQIAERSVLEGNGGFYEDREVITHPTSNDTVKLTKLATAHNKIKLGITGSIRRSITVRTRQYGFRVGQLVNVSLPYLGVEGSWIIQRLSMREEAGLFLVSTLELNVSSLIRRQQELWLDVVRKGTVSILPPSATFLHNLNYTTPGTYTFANATGADLEVQVSAYGGGGGGGGGAKSEWPGYGGINTANGSAGGGGGLTITFITMSPGEVLTIVVGGGGLGAAGQYRFMDFANAIGGNGAQGGQTRVDRPGGTICLANGGAGGIGGLANARLQQVQTWPPGNGGTGVYGSVVTVGGAANGGGGGNGVTYATGFNGGHGKVIIEY